MVALRANINSEILKFRTFYLQRFVDSTKVGFCCKNSSAVCRLQFLHRLLGAAVLERKCG
jgi:hypothetical protein